MIAPDLAPVAAHAARIMAILTGGRFPLTDEKATQRAIAAELAAHGVAVEREVRLGSLGIVDIRCGRVVIEVKLTGARRAIHRQCVRYAGHPDVDALILATARAVPLPGIDKPTYVVALGKAWL